MRDIERARPKVLRNAWRSLKLQGVGYAKLWHRFDYPEECCGGVLVWRVRIGGPKPRRRVVRSDVNVQELKYGITRSDCGRTWQHQGRDKLKLRKLGEGELRKDLFLLQQDVFPEALACVAFIEPRIQSQTEVDPSERTVSGS